MRPANWILSAALVVAALRATSADSGYFVYVSNERAGTVTVIDGDELHAIGSFNVGKRPRGIHSSPDGRTVYVALSGRPITDPHKAAGKPGADDDDDSVKSDKSADGIGVIDVGRRALTSTIVSGSDPEEFDLSKDGTQLYVSNEDSKAASVINIGSGKIQHVVPVSDEPEGVATSPDGSRFYVTCEASGEIFVVDTHSFAIVGHFKVGLRPRSVAFVPDSHVAIIPSESGGQLSIIDTDHFTVTKVITLPEGSLPMRVKISLDGRRIYVSDGRAGTVSVLDAHSFELIDTIKVGTRPWGMVLSPDGKYLFTANGPSDDVSVVDLATDKEIKRIKAGAGPWGLAIVQVKSHGSG